MKRGKRIICFTLALFSLFLLSCSSFDAQSFILEDSRVKAFLEENPNADIQVVHYSVEEAAAELATYNEVCKTAFTSGKEMYKAKIVDSAKGLKLFVYVDAKTKSFDCVRKFGAEGKWVEAPAQSAVTQPQDAQPSPTDTKSTKQPSAPSTGEELDGSSGGDAPDKFQDGQAELAPGEYASNALVRNDNFDETSDDVDFYQFTVAAGDWFKLTVTPENKLDVSLLLYDEGGNDETFKFTQQWRSDVTSVVNPTGKPTRTLNSGIAGKEESFWSQMSTEQPSYTFYFSVKAVKGTGTYAIQLETKKQNDGEAGKDAGEKPAKAIALEVGKEYPGLLNLNDFTDCYKLSTGGRTSLTVTPTEDLNILFTLHDEGGKDVTWDLTTNKKTDQKEYSRIINNADAGLPESIAWDPTGSTQYVCLKKKDSSSGYYTLGGGEYTIKYE